jgi:hypothetical protein
MVMLENHLNTLMFIFVVVCCRIEFPYSGQLSCKMISDEASSVTAGYDEMLLHHGCCTVLGECGAVIG